jgi:hypothetical protein
MAEAEYRDILRRAFANGNDAVHVDGWTSLKGQLALAWAEKQGYVTSFVSQSSQYTAINYTVTAKYRAEEPAP